MAQIQQEISGLTATEGASLFAGTAYNTTNNITQVNHETPLRLLPYAKQAAFNAYGKDKDPHCLKDTRVDILNQIRLWAEGDDERYLFWLKGWAGTGKSTIARTISREYYDKAFQCNTEGSQGTCYFFASFFFSRGESDLSNARKFVTTIAVQLGQWHDLRNLFRKEISYREGTMEDILHDQWKRLILEPLSKLHSEEVRPRLILVIDALDECDEDDIYHVVHLLNDTRVLQTVQLRVFITSRPEPDILHCFWEVREVYKDFILHDISRSVIDHDISTFLDQNFKTIARMLGLTEWPVQSRDRVIENLVRKAAGLFIWAATAFRFISKRKPFLPDSQLRLILEDGAYGAKYPEDELSKIYLKVLQNSVDPNADNQDKDSFYKMLKKILGSIVVLRSPLSAYSLASLLDFVKEEDVRQVLWDLHSILDVPENPALPIRLHHPSFSEFLLNDERCPDEQLCVDKKAVHTALAEACIQIMSKKLRKDICNLSLPGALTEAVSSKQIEQCLPKELQYACRYWVQHLQQSNISLPDTGQVHLFLRRHLLFWLEALSLFRKINEGVLAIKSLENLVKVGQSPDFYAFIHDAKRFILNFRIVIEKAPLQIYISALLFAPEMSLVRKEFKNQMPNWIIGLSERQEYWSPGLQALEGHSDWITDVVFSPDGKIVASASEDNTVRLWDSSTGAALQTLVGHARLTKAVAFSPNGKLVASASYDTTVRLWDSSTGAALQILKGHSNLVRAVMFSPDGMIVASSSDDKTVRLWDSSTGSALQTLEGHSGLVRAVVFSADGKLVASASDDTTLRLWDSSTGLALQTLIGHSKWVRAVRLSPDSKLVASASDDKTVRLWDSSTGAVLWILEGHSAWVLAIVFSPDGKLVASASADSTVRLWDSSTGAAMQTMQGHSNWVRAVAFSPDGKLVASGSDDKTVRLWDSSTGAVLQRLEEHSDRVRAVAFSADSKLVASASHDKTVRLWDCSTRAALKTLEGHSSCVVAIVFSPNWKFVASISNGLTVRLWDSSNGAALQILEGHSGSVRAVEISPDSKLVASASDDETVKLWDSSTGASLHTLKGHSNWIRAIKFSPDGKLIASASDDETVRLWDLSTGAALRTLEGHSDWIRAVVFSADGKLVASASDDETVRLWDSSTGAALQTLKGHSGLVWAVSFSPDNKLVASASGERKVRLWDSSTGAALWILEGHLAWVLAIVFSPDGKLVASASDDCTIRIWDSSTGVALQALQIGTPICRLSFSQDGYNLETDRGTLSLQSVSTDSISPHQPKIVNVFLDDRWIVGAVGKLLWLPPIYQRFCSEVRNSTVVIGHKSGRVTFLEFDLSQFVGFDSC